MIIDLHMHLGNILYNDGGRNIFSNIKYPNSFNIQRIEEDILKFNGNIVTKKIFALLDDTYTVSVQNRIAAGTLINLCAHIRSLLEFNNDIGFTDGKAYCCCLPVAPYVTADDVYEASHVESHIIPFTSIDPTLDINAACDNLLSTMQYCYGLKLHPIIQGLRFNDELTMACLDAFRSSNRPVILHAGASRYYIGEERNRQHCEYDNIPDAKKMIDAFPDINFVIGHAGIEEFHEWAEVFRHYENVYCDGSVQSADHLREIHNIYGTDRIVFATDWPCVRSQATIKAYKQAFTHSELLKITSGNALNLLGDVPSISK